MSDPLRVLPGGLNPSAAMALDCAAETARIEDFLKRNLRDLKRRGLVLGVSGGVDSAVCAHLAVRALGPDRVFLLSMPERDASSEGEGRAHRLCDKLGVTCVVEDITASLDAMGCYRRRDDAIRSVFPDYGPDWKQKITIADGGWMPHFNIVVQNPDGTLFEQRMPVGTYLTVVAATNFKQRVRKNLEYFHAERLNYAVLGTPNRLEYDLGFFVRGGDGLADIKPIAHLYKTQVYALAEYLGVPEEIRSQPPSTDTYSLPQTQEEFYFALSYQAADLVLYGMYHGIAPSRIAAAIGCDTQHVESVLKDFEGKKRVAMRTLRNAMVLEDAP